MKTYCDTGHSFNCNGHLRGSATLTPYAERLAVELSLSDLMSKICGALGSITLIPRMPGKRSTTEHRDNRGRGIMTTVE